MLIFSGEEGHGGQGTKKIETFFHLPMAIASKYLSTPCLGMF
jgi:hypothetical protein